MRSVCEKLFTRFLKVCPGRQSVYFQTGQTMVMFESAPVEAGVFAAGEGDFRFER